MTASPFIAVAVRDLLQRHRLDSFDALWAVDAPLVDEPNRARGGVSSVSRITLEDANGHPRAFYLKRQRNYLIRSPRRPLGEPTTGREFYNIRRYARLGIPALDVAYYAERRVNGDWQALLLTPALEGYQPLDHWFSRWDQLDYALKQQLLGAAGALVARLHGSGVVHQCLYPKHLFFYPSDGEMGARLIDLEKSRAQILSPRGKVRDLEVLNRRSEAPSRSQRLRFLLAYLDKSRVDAEVRDWIRRILAGQRKGRL